MNKKEENKKIKDWLDDWDKNVDENNRYLKESLETYHKSSGFKKTWNYFLEVIKTEYFQDFLKEARRKNKTPEGVPAKMSAYSGHTKESKKLKEEIVNKICKKYKLHSFEYVTTIQKYIYFDILEPPPFVGAGGLLMVSELLQNTYQL